MGKSTNPLLPRTYNIVWFVALLVVILVLFRKLVLPKFQEVLTEQEDRVEGGIERAKAAQTEVKTALERCNSQFAEVRTETAKTRGETCAQGQRTIVNVTTKANDENAWVIESDEKQLAAQREQVTAELCKGMDQNSVNLAGHLPGEQLSDDVRNSPTIDSFLSNLDTMAPAEE